MPMSIETIGVVAGALLTAFLVSLVTTPIVKTLAQKSGRGGCAQGRTPDA